MMEWLGGKFDPAAFDLEKTNPYLRMLKWPHTTDSPGKGRWRSGVEGVATAA
jgi:hypothetical protein